MTGRAFGKSCFEIALRRVNLQPTARREIKLVRAWYLTQGAPEAAEHLVFELDRAIRRLEHSAHRYSMVGTTDSGEPIRRLRLRRFPYTLVYVIDPLDVVQVFAFPHWRRDRYWLTRTPSGST